MEGVNRPNLAPNLWDNDIAGLEEPEKEQSEPKEPEKEPKQTKNEQDTA